MYKVFELCKLFFVWSSDKYAFLVTSNYWSIINAAFWLVELLWGYLYSPPQSLFKNNQSLFKILNSGLWKAKILKSDKILNSALWKAKILKSVKILNSGLSKAKILKSAKIVNSGVWTAKILEIGQNLEFTNVES